MKQEGYGIAPEENICIMINYLKFTNVASLFFYIFMINII